MVVLGAVTVIAKTLDKNINSLTGGPSPNVNTLSIYRAYRRNIVYIPCLRLIANRCVLGDLVRLSTSLTMYFLSVNILQLASTSFCNHGLYGSTSCYISHWP